MNHDDIIESTKRWVENFVIELKLCPFAKKELVNDRIRFVVSDAITEEQLLQALRKEFEKLNIESSIETTLLIHTNILQDFFDYNQFLGVANNLLREMQLEGVYQIASFHPKYQFDGTEAGDIENYTNRSPYPILHLLREDSIERAISQYPDVNQIPVRNIALMKSMGSDKVKFLLDNNLKNS